MEQTHPQPATYARALRIVAVAIALVAVAKHFTTDFPSPAARHDLALIRGLASAVTIAIALVCSPRRSMPELRTLAFALGVDIVFITVGVTIVVPAEVWQQAVSLVAMMFAAAVFMPWSWRWQATLVAIAVAAATVALLLVISRDLVDGHSALRVLRTLYLMGALSVVAAELDEIAAAARQGRDLTTELLRLTRSDPTQLRPTDVAEVVTGIARLAGAMLTDIAAVEVQVADGLPPVAADADQLVHACTQIVLNARDAMQGRPGGRLTLTAAAETIRAPDPQWPDAQPGRYVRVSLSDTGRGMSAAELERVFEPFFTTKPMHQAKGLGLATVHRVMREHRGAVRVESEPGRGTTVHLLLPV